MISVITLTYQRHHILEEAIQSFLLQDYDNCEMVILNDSPNTHYIYRHPKVRIINIPIRFDTIGEKLHYGMNHCLGDYRYRLDDDDLLAPNALSIVAQKIEDNPGFDLYRSREHHQFWDNKYEKTTDSINTGNTFSKKFINSIDFPHRSADEDAVLVFEMGASIFTIDDPTMIYRWNRNTYHISTHLHLPNEDRLTKNETIKEDEYGTYELNPHFDIDYWSQLP